MQGLYYLFSLIGIGIIAAWYVQNDALGPGKRTIGLLRMKEQDQVETTATNDGINVRAPLRPLKRR